MGVGRNRVSIGAIRWGAWNGDTSSATTAYSEMLWTLRPAKWADRYPFFAVTNVLGELDSIDGSSQEVVDREIDYAWRAGLDYWAFLNYGAHTHSESMMIPFGRYHASLFKHKLKFCMVFVDLPQSLPQWYDYVDGSVASWLSDPQYQRAPDGRPLFFIFPADIFVQQYGSGENGKGAIDYLRQRSESMGAGNPFIVAMHWDVAVMKSVVEQLGLDAMSAYSAHDGGQAAQEQSYATLMTQNEQRWYSWKAAGTQVIPTVNAGWDNRPIDERPASWYPPSEDPWFAESSPAEFAANSRKAVSFCRRYPATCEAETVVIYAWNEFAEGGYICPTLKGGSSRLDALGSVDRSPLTNAVEQSDFSSETLWAMHVAPSAEAKLSLSDGWGKVKIAGLGGTTPTDIQLCQQIELKGGATYSVWFKARAASKRSMHVSVHQHTSPWTAQWGQTVTIEATEKTFGPFWFVSGETSRDRRINFMLGGSPHDVWIDDVQVVRH